MMRPLTREQTNEAILSSFQGLLITLIKRLDFDAICGISLRPKTSRTWHSDSFYQHRLSPPSQNLPTSIPCVSLKCSEAPFKIYIAKNIWTNKSRLVDPLYSNFIGWRLRGGVEPDHQFSLIYLHV